MGEDIQRRIKEKITEIESKSANGDYIYRGEPEDYGKISSSLWREYGLEPEVFNIEIIQKEMLRNAKEHIGDIPQDYRADLAASLNLTQEESDRAIDFEILTEIQHYGGRTNLIDFTTDYFIALFFACDGHHDKEGRVILQKTEEIQNIIERPQNPRHRVIAQKSIFVRPPKGYIDKPHEDNVVIIPGDLKQGILQYLEQCHGRSKETIYNDVYGFIRYQNIHGGAYTKFFEGFAYAKRGDEATTSEERQNAYKKSIEHFTQAIKLNPNYILAYLNRGIVYGQRDDYERAIIDLDKVIDLNPNYAEAYYNRGVVYERRGDYEYAITDFDKVIDLNPNHVNAYSVRGYVYGRRGDYERAIEDCNHAIELDPNNSNAYSSRGSVHGERGDDERSIADCNRAIELDPNNSNAYSLRGVVYYKRGDYECAISEYTKAIDLDPNYVNAYYNRGEARLHLEEWGEARIDLMYAKDRGMNIIDAFNDEHRNVADFQRNTGITLPEDIAEMLTAT